jgi:hypothetical protein
MLTEHAILPKVSTAITEGRRDGTVDTYERNRECDNTSVRENLGAHLPRFEKVCTSEGPVPVQTAGYSRPLSSIVRHQVLEARFFELCS